MDETEGANDTPAIRDVQVSWNEMATGWEIATPSTKNPAVAGLSKELLGESCDASAALGEAGVEHAVAAVVAARSGRAIHLRREDAVFAHREYLIATGCAL